MGNFFKKTFKNRHKVSIHAKENAQDDPEKKRIQDLSGYIKNNWPGISFIEKIIRESW